MTMSSLRIRNCKCELIIVWETNNAYYFFPFDRTSSKLDIKLLLYLLSGSDHRYLSYKVANKHLKIDKEQDL